MLQRPKKPETQALREWAQGIARRRGKRIAVVARARRPGGILYALWRDVTRSDSEAVTGTGTAVGHLKAA